MNSSKTAVRRQVDTGLARATVVVPMLAVLAHAGDRITARVRRGDSELGASVVEWVVITALVVTMALAVGVVIATRVTGKANELDLTTP